jgi:hypothetical protein
MPQTAEKGSNGNKEEDHQNPCVPPSPIGAQGSGDPSENPALLVRSALAELLHGPAGAMAYVDGAAYIPPRAVPWYADLRRAAMPEAAPMVEQETLVPGVAAVPRPAPSGVLGRYAPPRRGRKRRDLFAYADEEERKAQARAQRRAKKKTVVTSTA